MTTGGCECGAVRYEFEGEPINQVFCYCTDCQRRTGSDMWYGLWIPHDQFRFVGEREPARHTQQSGSDYPAHHYFCDQCGVELCTDITVGGFYTLAATSVDGGWEERPKMAIFARSAAPWAVMPDDMPVFDTFPG